MKTRLFVALLFGLCSLAVRADDSAGSGIDSESLWVTAIAPAGDGSYVVGTATGLLLRPGTVSKVTADSVGTPTKLYEHPAAVWTVDVTSDGKTIASADYRGNLVVFDVAAGKATTHETAFERWCQSIQIAPDDKSVLAGNEAGRLFVWDLASAKVSKSIELSEASVTGLAFSPDGKQVAATDGSGKVHLLKWPELETIASNAVSEETAWCVAYDRSGDSVVVGSSDRKLYRVPAKAEAKAEEIAAGSDWITRIAVSDSGEIAASEVSGKIHFASGGSVTTIGAESGVWALCFGGPGQLLVGTRKNGIVTAGQTWTFEKPATKKPAAKVEEEADEDEEAEAAEEKPAEEKPAEEAAKEEEREEAKDDAEEKK